MVSKSSETEPVRNPITITVRATIPTQQYGNLTLEATQVIDGSDDAIGRSLQTVNGLERLKYDLALVVLPLAEAEVERCKSVLVKDEHPDAWLQRNSSLYRWLRVAEPELEIPAMETILQLQANPVAGSKTSAGLGSKFAGDSQDGEV